MLCKLTQGCSQGVFFTEALVEFQHVRLLSIVRYYEFGKLRELHVMLGPKLLLRQLPQLPKW